MKTVEKIIQNYGGLDALKAKHICIEKAPFMRLVIEYIGDNEQGWPMISIAHYGEQNGDAMRDPEMVFEICRLRNDQGEDVKLWSWYPRSFRNDYLGLEQVARWDNKVKPRLVRELKAFAKDWDKNIKEQGFSEILLAEVV